MSLYYFVCSESEHQPAGRRSREVKYAASTIQERLTEPQATAALTHGGDAWYVHAEGRTAGRRAQWQKKRGDTRKKPTRKSNSQKEYRRSRNQAGAEMPGDTPAAAQAERTRRRMSGRLGTSRAVPMPLLRRNGDRTQRDAAMVIARRRRASSEMPGASREEVGERWQ